MTTFGCLFPKFDRKVALGVTVINIQIKEDRRKTNLTLQNDQVRLCQEVDVIFLKSHFLDSKIKQKLLLCSEMIIKIEAVNY